MLSEHGVPIAQHLLRPIYQRRRVTAADLREERLMLAIARVHHANYGVYGARKVWLALNREGVEVARCTVERLMKVLGWKAPVVAARCAPPGDPAYGIRAARISSWRRGRRTRPASRKWHGAIRRLPTGADRSAEGALSVVATIQRLAVTTILALSGLTLPTTDRFVDGQPLRRLARWRRRWLPCRRSVAIVPAEPQAE